jgi:hypothetical protein
MVVVRWVEIDVLGLSESKLLAASNRRLDQSEGRRVSNNMCVGAFESVPANMVILMNIELGSKLLILRLSIVVLSYQDPPAHGRV